MSYIAEHNCPSTLVLINLRNSRDLAKASCFESPSALSELSPRVAAKVRKLVMRAEAEMTEAIELIEKERGKFPSVKRKQ